MRLTDTAKAFIEGAINAGDTVVDGTAGNGYDTLFLATCVGDEGKVVAFDVQAAAIAATTERLDAAGLLSRVELVHASHDQLAQYVAGDVKAGMFNLGFLPGSDKFTTTTIERTGPALLALLDRLSPRGRVTVMAYRGHAGGNEETNAVAGLIQNLDEHFSVAQKKAPANGPVLFMIERKN